jgi:putative sugar O-methyltransferase
MTIKDRSLRESGNEADLVHRIEADLKTYQELRFVSNRTEDLIPKWQELVDQEPKRFISDDYSVNLDALHNFRRLQIFIPDSPGWDPSIFRRALRVAVTGGGRGARRMLRECLDVLKEHGYQDLLQKYPCHPAGNPFVFKHEGYSYTYRWFKHIYFLGLLNRVLGPQLDDGFLALDIGSSYGIFSSLIKQEYPTSHHILVDFPEQLMLAYYFLGTCFPDARIAGVREVAAQGSLTRSFFEKYDFSLVPISLYDKIEAGSADLVSNFASFGEMSRTWFNNYVTSAPFQTAKYLLTANRMQSYPTYDTDLTVIDYPIWEPDKRIHFAVSPPFSHVYYYLRRRLFFNEKFAYPPYFEYVGRI